MYLPNNSNILKAAKDLGRQEEGLAGSPNDIEEGQESSRLSSRYTTFGVSENSHRPSAAILPDLHDDKQIAIMSSGTRQPPHRSFETDLVLFNDVLHCTDRCGISDALSRPSGVRSRHELG